jgi:hypothetical protein
MHRGNLDRHFRAIRKWHSVNRANLIAVWNSTRPADCPVGPILA